MGEFLSCVSGSSIVAGFNILVFETSEASADGGRAGLPEPEVGRIDEYA